MGATSVVIGGRRRLFIGHKQSGTDLGALALGVMDTSLSSVRRQHSPLVWWELSLQAVRVAAGGVGGVVAIELVTTAGQQSGRGAEALGVSEGLLDICSRGGAMMRIVIVYGICRTWMH